MKDAIINFIRENVLGKQLITDELTYSLEKGKMEGVYSDSMCFSDLTTSENGFQFNMTVVTKEKVYAKDSDGSRTKIVKDYTGAGSYRYELAVRKSTSQITGYMRLLSSSTRDHTMEAVVYGVFDMKLNNHELKWKEQQLLYRDMLADENKYRPVAFDSEIRFYMENGKLRFEYLPMYYGINPETFTKSLSKEQYPPFVAKEK